MEEEILNNKDDSNYNSNYNNTKNDTSNTKAHKLAALFFTNQSIAVTLLNIEENSDQSPMMNSPVFSSMLRFM